MDEHERSSDVSMDELRALVETAGGEVVAMIMQNRPTPDARSFIGDGKVREMKALLESALNDLNSLDRNTPENERLKTFNRAVCLLDAGITINNRMGVEAGVW